MSKATTKAKKKVVVPRHPSIPPPEVGVLRDQQKKASGITHVIIPMRVLEVPERIPKK
ncbi:MAG: hypothetical protein V3T70_07790 [Phycisphaerae bacterium]